MKLIETLSSMIDEEIEDVSKYAKQAFYTLANQKNVDPNVIINNLKNL